MTEELSVILEDVDPKIWSQEILIMKAKEMDELIERKRVEIRSIEDSYWITSDDITETDKKLRVARVELLFLQKRRGYLNKHLK